MGELVVRDRGVVGEIGARALTEDHRIEPTGEEGVVERLASRLHVHQRRHGGAQRLAGGGRRRKGGIEPLEKADVFVEVEIGHRRREVVARVGVRERGVGRETEGVIRGEDRVAARGGDFRGARRGIPSPAVEHRRLRARQVRARRQVGERHGRWSGAGKACVACEGTQAGGGLGGGNLVHEALLVDVPPEVLAEERGARFRVDEQPPVARRLLRDEIDPVDGAHRGADDPPSGHDRHRSGAPDKHRKRGDCGPARRGFRQHAAAGDGRGHVAAVDDEDAALAIHADDEIAVEDGEAVDGAPESDGAGHAGRGRRLDDERLAVGHAEGGSMRREEGAGRDFRNPAGPRQSEPARMDEALPVHGGDPVRCGKLGVEPLDRARGSDRQKQGDEHVPLVVRKKSIAIRANWMVVPARRRGQGGKSELSSARLR